MRATICIIISGLVCHAQDACNNKRLDEILAELRAIRGLLESGARGEGSPRAPTKVTLSVGDNPYLGKQDAPLTIVEFTDYECPFCRQFHHQTFADIKRQFIDPGLVRFFVVNLPLEIHPNAFASALAAQCAANQGRFWAMHERMQSDESPLITSRNLLK